MPAPFPLEIWREILIYAVSVRGLTRGLRLQLVCKLFAAEVDEAVFKSGLLDDECSRRYRNKFPRIKNRFHIPYIQNYALHIAPRLAKAPAWVVAIHEVANTLFDMSHARFPHMKKVDYVHRLCQTIGRSEIPMCPNLCSNDCWYDFRELDNDVLGLAIYFDMLSVAQDMANTILDRALNWEDIEGQFLGDPLELAAKYNKSDMLEYLLRRISTNKSLKARLKYQKVGKCIEKASSAGHLAIVDMLLAEPWAPIIYFGPWDIRTHVYPWSFLDNALETPSRAIFERILNYRQQTVLEGPIPDYRLETIARSFTWGPHRSMSMLRWFLNTHWRDPRGDFIPKSITLACQNRDVEEVHVLLECALPHEKIAPRSLSNAAAGGCMELVKLLVEHGNDIDEPNNERYPYSSHPPPIVSAIWLEDRKMFQYLREHGAIFDTPTTVGVAVGRAKQDGLDSMLEFMASEGTDLDLWPPGINLDDATLKLIKTAPPRCSDCIRKSKAKAPRVRRVWY